MADQLEYLLKLSDQFSGPAVQATNATKNLRSATASVQQPADDLSQRLARLKATINGVQSGAISAGQGAGVLRSGLNSAAAEAAKTTTAVDTASAAIARHHGAITALRGAAGVFGIISAGIWAVKKAAEVLSKSEFVTDKQRSSIENINSAFTVWKANIQAIAAGPLAAVGDALDRFTGGKLSSMSDENRTKDLRDQNAKKRGRIGALQDELDEETRTPVQNLDFKKQQLDVLNRQISEAQPSPGAGALDKAKGEALVLDLTERRIELERDIARLKKEVASDEQQSANDRIQEAKRVADEHARSLLEAAKLRDSRLNAQKDLQTQTEAKRKLAEGDERGAAEIENRRKAEKMADDTGLPIDEVFKNLMEQFDLDQKIDSLKRPPKEKKGPVNTFNEHAEKYGRTALDGVRQKIKGYSFEKQAPVKETFDEFFHGKKPRSFMSPEDIKYGKPRGGVESPGQLTRRERQKEAAATAAKQEKPRWDLVQSIEGVLKNLTVA